MQTPTYGQLKDNLLRQLDLQGEVFVRPDEILDYHNEGITDLESVIHTIYEDYFMVSASISITSGVSEYALPSDIFAQKIRRLLFNDGSANQYEIKYIRDLTNTMFIVQPDLYQYLMTNAYATGPRLKFYPVPNFTSDALIYIWYLRGAKKFTGDDAETSDIPEFSHVLTQYVRWRCYQKELHPATEQALQDLENMKMMMVETLTSRRADEDNKIIPDRSFYYDCDSWDYGTRGW